MRTAWLVIAALLGGGCSGPDIRDSAADAAPAQIDAFERIDGQLPAGIEEVAVFPAVPTRDLDVLFLIDNSNTMGEEQASLAANFPSLITALAATEGGLPNLHLGVISSNVGAGGQPVSACTGDGDNGRLQNVPRVAGCTPPSGAFIDYRRDEAGTEIKNYTDSLEATFSCIAQLGTGGCGFEQQLEAVRRALDGRNPENAGFLRDQAYLAVILLTDEDDCSAPDGDLFDPAQDLITDPLGPRTSFRCSEFGILCDGAPIGRMPGVKDPADGVLHCVPQGVLAASETGHLWHPQVHADFLRALKRNPAMISVTGITGPPEPVEIILDTNANPALAPACASAAGNPVPAVRLRWFLDQFPERNLFVPMCDADLSTALSQIATLVGSGRGQACVMGPLADQSSEPGLQAECRVWDVTAYGTAEEERRELLPCGDEPCYALVASATACPYDTHLEVQVHRVATPAADVTTVAECRRP